MGKKTVYFLLKNLLMDVFQKIKRRYGKATNIYKSCFGIENTLSLFKIRN